MNRVVSIAEHLERQSIRAMESTIPEGMTIEQWRRHRNRRATVHQLPVRQPERPLRRAA